MAEINEESWFNKEFTIPPIDTALTNGYYLHSTLRGYEQVTIERLPEADKIKTQLGLLRSKLGTMEAVEQQFYDMFGVKNAMEFSNTYLIEMGAKGLPPDATISQKLLAVFNSPTVFDLLTKPIQDLTLSAEMDRIADEFFDMLDKTGVIYNIGESRGTEALKQFLNDLAKADRGATTTYNSIKVQAPEKQIRSNRSKYIISILTQMNKDIAARIQGELEPRIQAVMQYAKSQLGHEDWWPLYSAEIENHLRNTAGLISKENDPDHYLDEKNLGMFFNYQGATGGMYEIVLTVALRTPEQIKSQKNFNQLQANDLVESVKKRYDLANADHVIPVKNRKGENVVLHYKSPTDLVISNGISSFNIQIKNTKTAITAENTLKLQNEIYTSTFLANVQPVIGDDSMLNLFIYHLVNQSLWGEYGSVRSGYDYMLKMLQICVEYYVESQYIQRVDQTLTSLNTSQLGNAFFIYAGHLIPISAFLRFAIENIEQPTLFFGNDGPIIKYGYLSEHDKVRGQPYKIHEEEGRHIYEASKLSGISIAIGQLLQIIESFEPIAASAQ